MTVEELQQFRQFVISQNPGLTQSQVNELDNFINQKMIEIVAESGVPLEDIKTDPTLSKIQAKRVESGDLDSEEAKLSEKQQTALELVKVLEDMYFGLDDESREILALGRLEGLSETVKAKLTDQSPKVKTYLDTLKMSKVPLAKALGEVGNLTAAEQNNAVAALGKITSSPEEAIMGFSAFRKIAQLPDRDILSEFEDDKKPEIKKNLSKEQKELVKSGQKKQKELKTKATPETLQTIASQPREKLSYEEGDNRLLYGMAKTQEFLANTPVLTSAGALLGRGISGGSSIGSGVGAGTGKYLQQILQPGETFQEKGIGALIPSGQEAKEIAGTGVKAGLLDFLLTGGKVGASPLKPVKFASALREKAAAKATGKISGDALIEAGEQFIKKASPGDVTSAKRMQEIAKETLSGKEFTAKEALDKLAQLNKAYTAAGKVGKSAKAGYSAELANNIRNQLKTVAPSVARTQSLLGKALRSQKAIKSLGRQATSVGIGTGIGTGLGLLLNKLKGE